MRILQLVHELKQNDEVVPPTHKRKSHDELLHLLKQNDMAPHYVRVCESLGWPVDKPELERMQAANAKKLKELDAKIDDAVENLGESEVREAHVHKSEYLLQIGDKVRSAVEAKHVVARALELRNFSLNFLNIVTPLRLVSLSLASILTHKTSLCRRSQDACVASYKTTFDKTVGAGSKLDLLLTLVRVAFFFGDSELAKRNIDQAKL